MDVATAAAAIRRGELVAMPTETVYGLAADATDTGAVLRVFAAKERPSFDPLIVHVAEPDQAWDVGEGDADARRLVAALWPGSLTLILPRRPWVGDAVTSGLDTVAVRCPAHPLARALINAAGVPLVAPSANRFGRISPTTATHVQEQLGDRVKVILDGGPCRVGVESTIVRTRPVPVILRPGGIAAEDLSAVLGRPVTLADDRARHAALPPEAPGLLRSHYAPRVPLRLRDDRWPEVAGLGVLSFRGDDLPPAPTAVEVLSPGGMIDEAAARLFAALVRLDATAGVEVIVAEMVPDVGLGLAINDRLRRAAGRG